MTVKRLAILPARNLRKRQTVAEEKLWSRIRNKQLNGLKLLRQHPVFYEYDGRERFFIADFYCNDLHLVIEIDGGIHEQQEDYDEIRSEIMRSQKNLQIIRFSNEQIMENIDKVINELKEIIHTDSS